MIPDYGCGVFNAFWENDTPSHLALMRLPDHEIIRDGLPVNYTDWALQRLDVILCTATPDELTYGIGAMLNDKNWRPNLVAVTALLLMKREIAQAFLDPLWILLDAGTWVAPQLCVGLSLLDDQFREHALQRLQFAEQHETIRDEKYYSALRYLYLQNGGTVSTLQIRPVSEEGQWIASHWLERFLEKRGEKFQR